MVVWQPDYALLTLSIPPTPCSVLHYPDDNHALDRPSTELDAWLNIALWLQEHLALAAGGKEGGAVG